MASSQFMIATGLKTGNVQYELEWHEWVVQSLNEARQYAVEMEISARA